MVLEHQHAQRNAATAIRRAISSHLTTLQSGAASPQPIGHACARHAALWSACLRFLRHKTALSMNRNTANEAEIKLNPRDQRLRLEGILGLAGTLERRPSSVSSPNP